MTDTGYTNTILLDCSRLNSDEGKSGNTEQYAQFTNKLGAGIKLNSGDLVQVHSGFISEVGCGQSTIEFQGKDLKTQYDVEEVYQELTQRFWSYRINGSEKAIPPYGDLPPFNAHCVQYKKRTNTHLLKDNEQHVSISYYKTSNGDGYFHLPRRYDAVKSNWEINSKNVTGYEWAQDCLGQGKGVPPAVQYDNYDNGMVYAYMNMPIYRNYNDIHDYRYGGTPATYTPNNPMTATTTHRFKKKNDNSRYTLFVKEITFFGERDQSGGWFPMVNYIANTAKGDEENIINNTKSRWDTRLNAATNSPREPCMSEYVWYKEDLKLTTHKGFSSPSSVAADITDQMNVRGDFETIHGTAGGTYGTPGNVPPFGNRSDAGMVQTNVSTSADATCYKKFACANPFIFTKQGFESYWGTTGANQREIPDEDNTATGEVSPYGLNWLNSHITIGVLRPELWEKGRNLYKNARLMSSGANGTDEPLPIGVGNGVPGTGQGWRKRSNPQMTNMVRYDQRHTGEIWTSLLWNQENLEYLKEFFEAQGRDPTLFGRSPAADHISEMVPENEAPTEFRNEGNSPNNSRYIHINPYDTTDNVTDMVMGWDNYEADEQVVPTPNVDMVSKQSAPIWIFFDKNRADQNTGGIDENDYYLRYGFARKRTLVKTGGWADDGTYDIIAFTTRLIGGISKLHFEASGHPAYPFVAPNDAQDAFYLNGSVGGATDYNRLLGYDPHFNAYGTDCICLYNGMMDAQVKTTANPNTTYYADCPVDVMVPNVNGFLQSYFNRLMYVGAQNPQLNFDSVGARFNWQNLHTPEHTGNVFDAGERDVPINPTASSPVWFLNKRPRKVIFCPDLRPYPLDVPIAFGPAPAVTQKYTDFNQNLMPWTIFDSDGGIFIEDFHVSEKDWAKSMWGILGFTYDQFNTKNPTYNRQFRVNDVQTTIADMGAVTTNANVDAQDLVSFRTNLWGAQFYNNSLPIVMGSASSPGASIYPFLPISTKDAVSAEITASQLPTKMLNAYYVIKSDLVGDYNYFGGVDGGQALPAMYVVNKENGFGDFFFEGTGQATFTVTKPRTLTQITTSIHNPDFTLANVSPNSAVIYKIIKNNLTPLNVAEQVLNDTKKSKGKL